MIPVDPNARTTLVLNRSYQAYAFFSARAAIRHMMNGRVKGIDADGNAVSWLGNDVENFPGNPSTFSWSNGAVSLFDDQPCLRSAPNSLTGEETQWPVPTVVVCTRYFGYRVKKNQCVNVRTLYKFYQGTCQYCLNKIPLSHATKDHVFPKSKGGSNDDFNLVLACKKCNSEKDDIFPYYNAEGQEIKPKMLNSFTVQIPDESKIREEWKPFLYV
jgi:5-methylcytosine-specific restriction endonuclease McrA